LILTYFIGEKFVTGQERFAPGKATSRVAPLARYKGIPLRGAPNWSRAQTHETGQYQRPLV